MALAAVRSKGTVLLLIRFDCYSHCNCSMFSCALLCAHSSFAIILIGERPGCFALFVFLVPCDCCVALPHDAMGLSAVCDCTLTNYFGTLYFIAEKRNFGGQRTTRSDRCPHLHKYLVC